MRDIYPDMVRQMSVQVGKSYYINTGKYLQIMLESNLEQYGIVKSLPG